MRIHPFLSYGCCTAWLILAVGLTIGSFAPLKAEQPKPFPYTAVLLEEAPIQSGPQADFYPTDRLQKGDQVEVYRVDNKVWLAIRPPRDSFSWVSAEHLELTESGTRARVINTPAKTRVGSRFGDIHDVEYISLNKGEVLELLGTKMLRDPDTGAERRWFKVAPPSGEFRWIHQDLVSRVEKHVSKPGAIKTFSLPGEAQTKALALNLAQPVEGQTAQPSTNNSLSKTISDSNAKSATAASPSVPANNAIEALQNEVEQAVSEQLNETFDEEELESVQRVPQKAAQLIATQAIKTQQIPNTSSAITTQAIPTQKLEPVAKTSPETEWTRKESREVASSSKKDELKVETGSANQATHHGFRIVGTENSSKAHQSSRSDELNNSATAAQTAKAPTTQANGIKTTHINAVTWEAVTDPQNPLAAPEPRTFEDSYEALNILLSRSVLGDILNWQLDRVFEQAALLKNAARSRDQLALASQLTEKIGKFQTLQKRKLAMQAELLAQAAAKSKAEAEVDAALAAAERAANATDSTKRRRRTEASLASYSAEDLAKKSSKSVKTPGRLPGSVVRSKFLAIPKGKKPQAKGPTLPRRVRSGQASAYPPSNLQPASALDNSVFDATGTLIHVHARRNGLPRYALTDSSGQITRFVSTGDGTSLDHLVNSKVGLLGEIGLLSELNKSHIIAFKAVKLNR